MRIPVRRSIRVGMLTAVVIGSALVGALYAFGPLDSTFGTGGRVETDFAGFADQAHDVVIQPDGKIIVVGWTDGPVLDFALTRYNTDGSLDASFGIGGKVSTPFFGTFVFGEAVSLQADGKIVVAGYTVFATEFAVARYHPDGTLDSTFGNGGTVLSNLGSDSFKKARGVVVQPDGAILVVGNNGSRAVIVRYTAAGLLDDTFGADGVVMIDFAVLPFLDPPSNGELFSVALQPDGRIVVAGWAVTGPDISDLSVDFAVARLNVDGTFDDSFGTNGRVTTTCGTADDAHATAVGIQPDGRVVIAGDCSPQGFSPTGPDFALARYNGDGTIDSTFGSNGLVRTDFDSSDDRASSLAVQPDGKLVAAGFSGVFGFPTMQKDFALARYSPVGTLDGTWGINGLVTTDFGGAEDEAKGVAIQTDGRIVAAGLTSFAMSGGDEDFALARYLPEGSGVLLVTVDVKPGSVSNPINVDSPEVIPIAILSTSEFAATAVDASTVCFGDAESEAERSCSEIHGRGHVADVNRDGLSDLVLHFRAGNTGIDAGDTTACLVGSTLDGTAIVGCDTVTTP